MKALFDTSVLVSALVKSHPQHARAYPWYLQARRGELGMVVAAHGLAELYATLTAYPSRPRISPGVAMAIIEKSISAIATIVALGGQDYMDAMRLVARIGRGGGSVYDALHVAAAEKAGAQCILSFNRKHFEPIMDLATQLVVP